MKKTYIAPQVEVMDIKMNYNLLNGSPGAKTGSTLQNEFDSTDTTYSSEFFDDENEEEW